MPEKDSKPTPETGIEDLPGAEQAASDASAPDKEAAAKPAARRKKKSRLRGWFWFLVLLLILLGLSLGWEMTPQNVRLSVLHKVHETFLSTRYGPDVLPGAPPRVEGMPALKLGPDGTPLRAAQPATSSPAEKAPAAKQATPPAASSTKPEPAPMTEPAAPAKPVQTRPAPAGKAAPTPAATPQESASAPAAETPAPQPAMSPDQAAALLDQMHRLQGELATVRAAQGDLRQQLQARNVLELRTRLRLLASPDSRLAQQAALWSEVAVLPDLDAAQRSAAESMAAQAQQDLGRLDGWRKALVQLAGKLPEKQQADILPKTGNKYFAWLSDAFHLRPAPGAADKQRAGLRRQVMDMEQNLAAENWPAPRDWRRLLGALRDQFGDKADLGLPESMQDVERNLAGMRAKAADWLAGL